MAWTDIRRKYSGGGALASQSTEDMAARRILHALGLSEKRLPAVEKALGLDAMRQADTTLLERAGAVAKHSSCGPLPPVRDVKSDREAEEAVLELAEQRAVAFRPAALVYRIAGSQDLRAKLWIWSGLLELDKIPLPCRVSHSRDSRGAVVDCDAQDYYSSLTKGGVQWTNT